MSDFATAMITVFKNEGGYVNNPKDPGGETNFGISKRTYPNEDIRNLTKEKAKVIYKRDWWDEYGYERIGPQAIATKILDMAVNMGATRAHKVVAQGLKNGGLKVSIRSRLGPGIIKALNENDTAALLKFIRQAHADFYNRLVTNNPQKYGIFLKGWLRRASE